MGGPSRRRFTEYQKPSGRSPLPPRKPTAFRMATSQVPSIADALVAFIPPFACGLSMGMAGLPHGPRARAAAWDVLAPRSRGWPRPPVPGRASGQEVVGGVHHDRAGVLHPHAATEL